MARIGNYPSDDNISRSDKIVGTDLASGSTKNFTLGGVSDWLNSTGAIKVAGQSVYKFQTEGVNSSDRLNATISLERFSGDGKPFSEITELIFSEDSITGEDSNIYIASLVSRLVILSDLNAPNNFGVYTLTSFEEMPLEPGFYKAVLSFENGNGVLTDSNSYGFAAEGLESTGASWGNISGNINNQDDLIDLIDNQIGSIPTPPTPTLQSVTDEGTTTDNSIEVGGLTVTTPIKNYNPNLPDIGPKQYNELRGYGDGYISNKTIAYSRISSAAFDEEGAIRIKDNVFQTYIGGEWQDVPTGFRFRQDSNGNYEFEHKPTGFDLWIEVSSGNSDILGFNGLPLVQQYAVSIGAYPVPLQLDGGTF